ncbi:MAG: SDR family oxidoreductase [Clostridiales bacterium]|jgi:NAD(P)-dependent dehydrogenase (short-subunit alcohol dehydrogenase family)|nr:SDR family oxidoreductase [Clostridiales bacterium]
MNKIAVITGAGGVLCGVIAADLAARGYKTALLDINGDAAKRLAEDFRKKGFEANAYAADVLNKADLERARERIEADFGACDLLVNGAGGNNPSATTDEEFYGGIFMSEDTSLASARADGKEAVSAYSDKNESKTDSHSAGAYKDGNKTVFLGSNVNGNKKKSFFDLTEKGVDFVFDLNFKGTFLATQVFAECMAERGGGNIINISSMNAFTPLTKIPAYSAAKAAVSNFTEWLAVYFAGAGVRVNALAPGFFITNQNRTLLFQADGAPTERAKKILSGTPMKRFGEPGELLGAVRFLSDDGASGFVTGVVLPIDGGFNAYSGV